MKIMVCTSNVPGAATKIAFTNNNTQFNTTTPQFISNPYYTLLPHVEHVTQTGISIKANLYIAVVITGPETRPEKINSSKNKNTEVLFFSEAVGKILGSTMVKKNKTS